MCAAFSVAVRKAPPTARANVQPMRSAITLT
jgi:hypothetical protein